jgi:alkanesulfonate monooxygenase SsuD/methylene tetrahydromethanopterin reductase-like flavin-dependent oxidoreductase (luciferase family)
VTSFGLLLPHFGGAVAPDRMVDGVRLAEALGFTSVWVRDHLVYEPHGFEPGDRSFLEAFTTLAYVAGQTQQMAVGTGAVIPTRHPLHLAQTVATLSQLLGPGRVALGLGAGGSDREMEVVGLGAGRAEVVRRQAELLRRLWAGEAASSDDPDHRLRGVSLRPPSAGRVPLLYCGGTPAAVRLAADTFDGWLPGRITLPTLAARLADLRARFSARGAAPIVGMIPLTSVGASAEEALAGIDLQALLDAANRQRFWVRPPSGRFESAGDLAGSLLAGSPEEVAGQVRSVTDLGLDLLVFDLRLRFRDWEGQLRLLGEEVLPLVQPTVPARVTGPAPDCWPIRPPVAGSDG